MLLAQRPLTPLSWDPLPQPGAPLLVPLLRTGTHIPGIAYKFVPVYKGLGNLRFLLNTPSFENETCGWFLKNSHATSQECVCCWWEAAPTGPADLQLQDALCQNLGRWARDLLTAAP